MLAEAKTIKKKLQPVKNRADISKSTIRALTNIKSALEDSEDDEDELDVTEVQIVVSSHRQTRDKRLPPTLSGKSLIMEKTIIQDDYGFHKRDRPTEKSFHPALIFGKSFLNSVSNEEMQSRLRERERK
jgi:hypothetical protein